MIAEGPTPPDATGTQQHEQRQWWIM
jgi:hypothetical protein